MVNQENVTAENFVFEQVEEKPKELPEVTIYKNGLVRFSRKAIEKYGLQDAAVVWGESENQDMLALRRERGGRPMRGEHKDTTSCPLRIAERHVGRYKIECVEEVMVRRPLA